MMQVHKEVVLTIISFMVCYAAITFLLWDLNPRNWGEGWRAAFVGASGYLSLWSWIGKIKL